MGGTIDARTFREAMARYLEALRSHRQELDSLNVFPVPDGDTGTNMLLTQEAVEQALGGVSRATLSEQGETVVRAALMGARGNSGVILSQVYRGLCHRLCREDTAGPEDLAAALQEASDQARAAVAEPAEGTMLSVLREAAAAAERAGEEGASVDRVAAAGLEEGATALERTREQLPALRDAGVVDAGGKGILLLLDAIVSAVRDVPLSVEVGPAGPVGQVSGPSDGAGDGAADSFGFEVMYLLESEDAPIEPLRLRLGELGDSVVVVGGGGLFNVHVHTPEAGAAVEAGIEVGRPRDIRITSLDAQVAEACLAGEARAVRVGGGASAEAPSRCGVVAVAPGDGIAALFRSLGASVVEGGPGRNPSVGELVAAASEAAGEGVLLLPNHPNVVPAAEGAAAEMEGVTVIPTGSVLEGLAAAAACNPEEEAGRNAERAREALTGVVSVEVAVATREAETPAGRVRDGQLLGIAGGEVRVVGEDPVDVLLEVIRPLVGEEHEVLTALVGNGVGDGDRVRRALAEAFPRLAVEVHHGGQPHYPILAGLE